MMDRETEIGASWWFYYKNISQCMVLWMSKTGGIRPVSCASL